MKFCTSWKNTEMRVKGHFAMLAFILVLRLCLILAEEASKSVFQFSSTGFIHL